MKSKLASSSESFSEYELIEMTNEMNQILEDIASLGNAPAKNIMTFADFVSSRNN